MLVHSVPLGTYIPAASKMNSHLNDSQCCLGNGYFIIRSKMLQMLDSECFFETALSLKDTLHDDTDI